MLAQHCCVCSLYNSSRAHYCDLTPDHRLGALLMISGKAVYVGQEPCPFDELQGYEEPSYGKFGI